MTKFHNKRFLFQLLLLGATGTGGFVGANGDPDISGLKAWRDHHFEDLDGLGIGNNRADPDRDGVLNLMEYALGLDPTIPDACSSRPRLEMESNRAVFRYNRAHDGITYEVQASSDLKNWSSEGVNQGGAAVGETVASYPLEGNDPTFFRLRVDDGQGFVALHGGDTELQPPLTVEAYEALTEAEQANLIKFLKSL